MFSLRLKPSAVNEAETAQPQARAAFWSNLDRKNTALWLLAGLVAVAFWLALILSRIPLVQSYRADQLDTIVVDEQNRGFHAPQTDAQGRIYRWSDAKSYVLFDFTARRPLKVTVLARSAAVAGGPDQPVAVLANGIKIGKIQPDPRSLDFTPFTFTFIPATTDQSRLTISFEAATFQAPGDPRPLGFQIQGVTIDRTEAWSPIANRLWLVYLLLPLGLGLAVLGWLGRRRAVWVGVGASFVSWVGAGLMLAALALLATIGVIDQTQYWLWVGGCAYLAVFFLVLGVVAVPWGRLSLYERLRLRLEPVALSHPVLTAYAAIALFNLALTAVFYLKVYFETGSLVWFSRFLDGPEYVFIAHGIYDPNDALLQVGDFARHSRAYWTAHFPLFPLVLKLFVPLGGYTFAPLIANLIISTLFAWAVYRLLRDFNYTSSPLWLTLVALVLPVRWLVNHTVGSSEPLFMLCTVVSFYCFKKGWYWRAGLAGLAAAWARPNGIFLWAGFMALLVWEVLVQLRAEGRFSFGRVGKLFNWRAAIALSLIPIGTLTVFALFAWRYGDFLIYFKVPEGVARTVLPFGVLLYNGSTNTTYVYYFLAEIAGLILLWRQKRFDVFWVGLATVGFTIFLVHPDILRYSLPAFPFLLLIPFAPYLSSRTARWLAIPALIFILLYSWGYLPTGMMYPNEWARLHEIAP